MEDDQIREVWAKVAMVHGQYSVFVESFATTIQFADFDDFQLLKPVALLLMEKYNLT